MEEESISLLPEVLSVVNGPLFIRAVRSHCILLGESNTITDEAIREIALVHSYPRIGLILASSKDSKGNPVLGGIGQTVDYSRQYREVTRIIVSPPYRDDIHRIAAQLTAAHIIKRIPLNSTLQFYNLGVQLEEQAIADLERLVGAMVITPDIAATTPAGETYERRFFFGGTASLDMNPARAVRELSSLPGMRAFCWYYMTSSNGLGQLSVSSGHIELPLGVPIESAIAALSIELNEAAIRAASNIITSPDCGPLLTESVDSRAVEYVPASLRVTYRHTSVSSSKEVLVLKFYAAPVEGEALYPIPSLLYGTEPGYASLSPRGPQSVMIDVPTGKEAGVSSSSSSKSASNQASSILDTIYFRVAAPLGEQESLQYRVSSSLEDTPLTRIISLPPGASEAELAFSLLEDLQRTTFSSYVLGAMPQPNALQLVLHQRSNPKQARVILDILQLPRGVEIATGSPLRVESSFLWGPRSIWVESSSINSKVQNAADASLPGLSISRIRLSERMQGVYDHMNNLKRRH